MYATPSKYSPAFLASRGLLARPEHSRSAFSRRMQCANDVIAELYGQILILCASRAWCHLYHAIIRFSRINSRLAAQRRWTRNCSRCRHRYLSPPSRLSLLGPPNLGASPRSGGWPP